MFTLFAFKEYGKKIIYIKEMNNYIDVGDPDWFMEGESYLDTDHLLLLLNRVESKQSKKIQAIINKLSHNDTTKENQTINLTNCTIAMHSSRICNLACKYCFTSGDKGNYLPEKEISLEIAQKALNYIMFDYASSASKYIVDLAGSGEPLLNLDFIKNLEEYCATLRNETGKDIKIMFPTNATLLTTDIAEYFETKSDILLGISIDGSKQHCINRIMKNGFMGYDKIDEGIKNTERRTIGLAATITHANEEVDVVYDELYHRYKNVDAISMQLVRDYSSDAISVYQVNLNNLLSHYKILANKLISHIIEKDYSYVLPILRGTDTFGNYIIRIIKKGKIRKRRCVAGEGHLAVDAVGNLYACSVANGNPDFKIGSIWNGIDKQKQIQFTKNNVEVDPTCEKCWAAYICGGECQMTGYLTSGERYKPNTYVCQYRKDLIKLSIAFVEQLKSIDEKGYEFLYKFAVNKPYVQAKADSGVWALNAYLKLHGINHIYSSINNLKKSEHGLNPSVMEGFLKKYKKNLRIQKLESAEEYEEIHFPVIVYLNKMETLDYEYAILLEHKNGLLKIQFLQYRNSLSVPTQVFFGKYSSIIFM
jgi:radical SAM protein with 4Fe4S-binding SPASM domain